MAKNSFFSGLNSYGKWDKISSEELTAEDKKTIDHVEVADGQYGLSLCFFLVGTKRFKMIQLDEGQEYRIGSKVDVDSIILNHYTDGEKVSTRAECSIISE